MNLSCEMIYLILKSLLIFLLNLSLHDQFCSTGLELQVNACTLCDEAELILLICCCYLVNVSCSVLSAMAFFLATLIAY